MKSYGTKKVYTFLLGKTISEGVLNISYHDDLRKLTAGQIENVKVSIEKIRQIKNAT